MPNNKLKEYIQVKKNPDLALFKKLESLDSIAKTIFDKVLNESIKEAKVRFEQEIEKLLADIPKTKKNISNELLNVIKDHIGKDGVAKYKGESGKDGRTPEKGKDYFTQGELDNLIYTIKGMIPDPKDGKDADEEFIIKNVLKNISIPKDGKNGKDGSPDKPEEIAEKLNKTSNSVDAKVIRGLDALIRRFIPQQSGGGMGNVTHQTINVGSTTITSTLTYNVAAGGNAIWVYYQGQHLVKDTHYTLSGRTIAWLETFVDSTYVDVTYIRTA